MFFFYVFLLLLFKYINSYKIPAICNGYGAGVGYAVAGVGYGVNGIGAGCNDIGR